MLRKVSLVFSDKFYRVIFGMIKKIFLLLAMILLIILGLRTIVPKPALLENYSFSQAVFDEHEKLLHLTLADDEQYRLFVPLEQIDQKLITAFLLQEDRWFFFHLGFNPLALLQATYKTYIQRDRRYGASTITMQLARLRFNINSKSIWGKLEQLIRAEQLELFYSKKAILEAYLNLVPYGGNIIGVGAASQIYFGRLPKSLTLIEALTLAVIPQNPQKRSIHSKNLRALLKARAQLFQRWVIKHPRDRVQKALLNLPISLNQVENLPMLAPHFVYQVLKKIENNHGKWVTTLNYSLQKIVESTINHYIKEKNIKGVQNAAALLLDFKTMHVKALVGSADFFNPAIHGQVDGTLALRSPGSTLKPFIYALALEQGLIHPKTILKDTPQRFGNYNPENFDQDFLGPIRAQDALIMSRNIPAINLTAQLKSPSLYQFLQKAKIKHLKKPNDYGLSLALGSAEMSMLDLARLYAMLANGGELKAIHFMPPLIKQTATKLLSPESAFITLDMLTRNPRPNSILLPQWKNKQLKIAWKTGTSSGFRDAWAIAIFDRYVLVVWVGDFEGHSQTQFIGRTLAGPLLFNMIDRLQSALVLHKNIQAKADNLNLKSLEVCAASGKLLTPFCPQKIKTWFIPGKSPITQDDVYREIAIDRHTGLRACEINKNTIFKVYEFWSSDLLELFAQAGIKRNLPPSYNPQCSFSERSKHGAPPKIMSPYADTRYVAQKGKSTIPLKAWVDADVRKVYWFVENNYLGEAESEHIFFWHATPGLHTVHVVDDHGRTDRVSFNVN